MSGYFVFINIIFRKFNIRAFRLLNVSLKFVSPTTSINYLQFQTSLIAQSFSK